jgi:F-type H+-transporting ATPase subunit gamma
MPSAQQLKRRIRSVENTAKITKAMSMIAASKMRRTQEMALRGRPYNDHINALLADLAAQPHEEDNLHPLLRTRDAENITIVHVTPDRGLTGGLNTSINREAAQFILHQSAKANIIAAGKKGRDFMVNGGQDVKAVFTDLGDQPSLIDVAPIARLVIDDYTAERVDAVFISYASFVSTTNQQPIVIQLLPVVPAELKSSESVGYIYEPDSMTVLTELLPRFVEMQIYHSILESIASEQSARMVAMRNATDNANEMVDDLTLVMNKARQESITKELLDIVGGAVAVEQ